MSQELVGINRGLKTSRMRRKKSDERYPGGIRRNARTEGEGNLDGSLKPGRLRPNTSSYRTGIVISGACEPGCRAKVAPLTPTRSDANFRYPREHRRRERRWTTDGRRDDPHRRLGKISTARSDQVVGMLTEWSRLKTRWHRFQILARGAERKDFTKSY